LTGLSPEALTDEVAGSQADLEGILGHSVTSFAYPYGCYNRRTIEALQQAGVVAGVTTSPGFLGEKQSLFEIPRIGVFCDDSLSKFSRKVLFADTEVSWPQLAGRLSDRIRRALVMHPPA
jgi:peptidoglycan/xylan/chitin deacetylase (PgdA/CDA1 family)